MDTLSAVSSKLNMISGQPVNSHAINQSMNDAKHAEQSVSDVRGVDTNQKVKDDSEQDQRNKGKANFLMENVRPEEEQDISELAKQLQESVDKYTKMQKNLRFSTNDDPACRVISVIDASTEETIRQIPSEEALELMKRMGDLYEEFSTPHGNPNEKAKSGGKSLLMDTMV